MENSMRKRMSSASEAPQQASAIEPKECFISTYSSSGAITASTVRACRAGVRALRTVVRLEDFFGEQAIGGGSCAGLCVVACG